MKSLFLRLFALPLSMSLMWIFYSSVGDDAKGFYSKSSMILNILGLAYGAGVWVTISLCKLKYVSQCNRMALIRFPHSPCATSNFFYSSTMAKSLQSRVWRRSLFRYNASACLWISITAIFNHFIGDFCLRPLSVRWIMQFSMFFQFFSIFPIFHPKYLNRIILNANDPDGTAFTYLLVSLWSSYILAEQLCITLLLFVKSKINVAIIVSYIFCVSLALASGTVRSFKGLQPWLQENTKATHTRYASTLLHSAVFLTRRMNCTPGGVVTCPLTSEYL